MLSLNDIGLSEGILPAYLLIVVRLSAALVVMPFFGAQGMPPQTKIGLALFMGLILLPLQPSLDLPPGLGTLVAATLREGAVGLALGFGVALVLRGVEAAGGLIGVQMGFGLGEVLDPLTGATSTELQRFYSVLAALVFFLVNAHHQVITGLFSSFELLPLNTFTAESLEMGAVVQLSAGMLILAVRIALPVVAAVFLTDVSLAVIARTMPQLNVLIVGLPVKIGVGVFVLMAALPITARIMDTAFNGIFDDMTALLTPAQRVAQA